MAVDVLISRGVPEERILFLNLIASPEGIQGFAKRFPKLRVVTAFIDQVGSIIKHPKYVNYLANRSFRVWTRRSKSAQLQSSNAANHGGSYIVPGLGDFGDRFYTM